jgi:hypothetical protein
VGCSNMPPPFGIGWGKGGVGGGAISEGSRESQTHEWTNEGSGECVEELRCQHMWLLKTTRAYDVVASIDPKAAVARRDYTDPIRFPVIDVRVCHDH